MGILSSLVRGILLGLACLSTRFLWGLWSSLAFGRQPSSSLILHLIDLNLLFNDLLLFDLWYIYSQISSLQRIYPVNITIKNQKDALNSAQTHILFLNSDVELSEQLSQFIVELYPSLTKMLQLHEFKGAANTVLSIPFMQKNESIGHVICAGLGSIKNVDLETYRRAVARAIQKAVHLTT